MYYYPFNPPFTIDIWIKYNNEEERFEYKIDSDYYPITNGQLLKIWEMKDKPQSTALFPDYWVSALAAINDGNDHPKLVWGPYPYPENLAGNIIGYRVYRSANHPPGQPSGFSLLATINDPDVFVYTDNSATIGNDYNANSYYVKAIYSPDLRSIYETSATNIVEVQLQTPQKRHSDKILRNNEYSLEQNYPNPFNPITTIRYSLPENSFVLLKVYDILGNVVTDLVNDKKEAGNYSILFDSSSLSSGLYIYILQVNGYSFTKKMILAK
jgi:hypothetical protein